MSIKYYNSLGNEYWFIEEYKENIKVIKEINSPHYDLYVYSSTNKNECQKVHSCNSLEEAFYYYGMIAFGHILFCHNIYAVTDFLTEVLLNEHKN